MTVTAIVIPCEHDEPMWTTTLADDTLHGLQRLVGGLIDVVDIPHDGTMVFHDEGKLIGLPVNYRATALLWALRTEFIDADVLNGDVIIVGQPDDDGDTTSAPAIFVQLLDPAAR